MGAANASRRASKRQVAGWPLMEPEIWKRVPSSPTDDRAVQHFALAFSNGWDRHALRREVLAAGVAHDALTALGMTVKVQQVTGSCESKPGWASVGVFTGQG
jgi:hypothetical protein